MVTKLLRFVIGCDVSFYSITCPEFREMLESMGAMVKVPSFSQITHGLDMAVSRFYRKLSRDLQQTSQSISLSFGTFENEDDLTVMIGVLGSWVTPDFKLRNCVLGFEKLDGWYSGWNMAEQIQKIVDKFDIGHKIFTITANNHNALHNEVLLQELSVQLAGRSTTGFVFGGLESYIRCAIHELDHIFNNFLSKIDTGKEGENDWKKQVEHLRATFDDMKSCILHHRLSMIVPFVNVFGETLDDIASRRGKYANIYPDIATAASESRKTLTKYCHDHLDTQEAFVFATILDPRFKTRSLEIALGHDTTHAIIACFKKLMDERYPAQPSPSPSPSREEDNDSAGQKEGESVEDWVKRFERRLMANMLRRVRENQLPEIDRYLKSNVVYFDFENSSENDDWLLSWWRDNAHGYPRLAAAARDYLAIPVSSMPIEEWTDSRKILFTSEYDLELVKKQSFLRGNMDFVE